MVYDYRHELIELLNHTASDPESLLQTQRSLTIIVDHHKYLFSKS